jgi:hypothetical protein
LVKVISSSLADYALPAFSIGIFTFSSITSDLALSRDLFLELMSIPIASIHMEITLLRNTSASSRIRYLSIGVAFIQQRAVLGRPEFFVLQEEHALTAP